MSRAPQNTRSRRTRDALLAATRTILEGEGFAALTMGAVAERAGVSRRAVYLHFSTRTDLVLELFGYMAEQEGLAESIAPVWAAPDGVAALAEWARHLARYHPRLMAIDRAIQRVEKVDEDAARHRRTVNARQYENCSRIAGWLERDGRLAARWTAGSAADMLFALISTDMIGRLLEERGWSPDEIEEHLVGMFHDIFVAR